MKKTHIDAAALRKKMFDAVNSGKPIEISPGEARFMLDDENLAMECHFCHNVCHSPHGWDVEFGVGNWEWFGSAILEEHKDDCAWAKDFRKAVSKPSLEAGMTWQAETYGLVRECACCKAFTAGAAFHEGQYDKRVFLCRACARLFGAEHDSDTLKSVPE